MGSLKEAAMSNVNLAEVYYVNGSPPEVIKMYRNENGEPHKEDGPAIELNNGTKEWCVNGNRHREDGPAIESKTGSKSYYLNGIRYSFEEWDRLRKLQAFI